MSLYARILGSSFERLSPVLQKMHDARSMKRYAGRCDVVGGSNWAGRTIGRIMGLPAANADVSVKVVIQSVGSIEYWTRDFGGQRFRSVFSQRHKQLQERLGPIALTFDLVTEEERIVWLLKGARLRFIPLPILWFLRCTAVESVQDGRYAFDVSAQLRGIGRIVRYKGWLVEGEQ